MANAIDVKVDSAQLQKFFKESPTKTKKGINQGLSKAGEIVRNAAKKNAPKLRGDLGRSIKDRVIPLKNVRIGTDKVYARIQEFGGTINAKNSKFLRFKVNGKWVSVKKVTIKGKPYLVPAMTDNKDKIQKEFKIAILRNVAKK